MSGDVLERLVALLRDEGGLMATLVDDCVPERGRDSDGMTTRGEDIQNTHGDSDGMTSPAVDTTFVCGPAQLAASGPRAEGRREEYELLVEAIYEGYLLHYSSPRVMRPPEADLGLLAGDQLYAIGLARLVALGDTAAVAELADTITLSALAQCAGEQALADAVWAAGARAVGWGSSEAHRRAKDLAFAGAPEAVEAMRTSATEAGLDGPAM
jgi:hypothetical protein